MNPSFRKGALTLCVLALVKQQDRYGYDLAQILSREFSIAEGSVYPLLRRLTKEGFFTAYLRESSEGPPRKYYRLTPAGEDHLQSLIREWKLFIHSVNKIIEEEINGEKKAVSKPIGKSTEQAP